MKMVMVLLALTTVVFVAGAFVARSRIALRRHRRRHALSFVRVRPSGGETQ